MSKLDIIDSILAPGFKDNTDVLIEINQDNRGRTFEMKRKIVSNREIDYLVYKYDTIINVFPFFKQWEFRI